MQYLDRLKNFWGCARALGRTPFDQWNIFWKQTKNFRVRLKCARHYPDQKFVLPTIYGHLHFRDNFGDITNLANLIYRKVYKVEVIGIAGVIIDVGANIGLAARWFSHFNPDKDIYCFEPLPGNAEMAKLNCPKAKVQNIALGRQAGRATLQVDRDAVMASSISCTWSTQEYEFQVETLDAFRTVHGFTEVALLKIDVEGMELEVLDGAEQTLKQTSLVVMETHGTDRHGESRARLVEAGFSIDHEEFDGATGMIFASRPGSTDQGQPYCSLWGLRNGLESSKSS